MILPSTLAPSPVEDWERTVTDATSRHNLSFPCPVRRIAVRVKPLSHEAHPLCVPA